MTDHESRPPGVDPEADLAWCHDAVQGVSRTFALTIDALDEPMSTHICLGYLLCRVADTIEDANHIPPDPQAELLRTYDAAIDPDADTDIEEFRAAVEERLPPREEQSDDWVVVDEAPRIAAAFDELPDDVQDAIVPPVRELIDGMAMFVERHADSGGLRIDDAEELEEYCYYAAGTVGTLITNLLTRGDIAADRRQRLYDTAVEFGLLLQLVNISKDVYDDYTEENNVYLPAEWLAEEGVTQDDVVDPDNRAAAASVVSRTVGHARSFLDDAERYLQAMPLRHGNTMAAWGVPFLLAVGTLRELRNRPEDALTDRGVKISRQEVGAVMSAMHGEGGDSLRELRELIAAQPYHRATADAD
ncbi:phytoene/squalene synthase family protein [Halonotius roseus]|uniref:Squalene/phytoene synthase family protein n=1 Tax=Halonotius roseus TaxID=2511997 RepID=A0A544QPU7_9EURY|nr:phytoene/squalene synthase family protein [Halonotius roseus]TQQ81446.1 squalene/phytoene synthase family protein [Halonotius roseus]